jgi:hypothetical protein
MEETAVVLSFRGGEEALIRQTRVRADEVRRLMEREAAPAAVDEAAEGFGRAAIRALEQQEDAASAERTMRRIEEGVEEQPAQVQERIGEELSGGSGTGSGSGSGDSGSSGSTGSGESGSGAGGSGSGDGSGNPSAPKGSDGGSGSSGKP